MRIKENKNFFFIRKGIYSARDTAFGWSIHRYGLLDFDTHACILYEFIYFAKNKLMIFGNQKKDRIYGEKVMLGTGRGQSETVS